MPLVANGVSCDSTPGEVASAASGVEVVDKDTESSEPASRDDDVGWSMEQVRNSREHPDKGEQEGDDGEDDDVDLSAERTSVSLAVDV